MASSSSFNDFFLKFTNYMDFACSLRLLTIYTCNMHLGHLLQWSFAIRLGCNHRHLGVQEDKSQPIAASRRRSRETLQQTYHSLLNSVPWIIQEKDTWTRKSSSSHPARHMKEECDRISVGVDLVLWITESLCCYTSGIRLLSLFCVFHQWLCRYERVWFTDWYEHELFLSQLNL